MIKKCNTCQELKEHTEYYDHKGARDGHRGECKNCRNSKLRLLRKTHPDIFRNHEYKKSFGITLDQVNILKKAQDHKCAICKIDEKEVKRLYVDHCHTTKKVRGLLCHRCNFGIGQFKDSQDLLELAANYLQAYNGPN